MSGPVIAPGPRTAKRARRLARNLAFAVLGLLGVCLVLVGLGLFMVGTTTDDQLLAVGDLALGALLMWVALAVP